MKGLKSKLAEKAKPFLIIVAVLIALAVTATGFAKIESLWFIFPLSGIRISTLITAFICFATVLFLQKKNTLKSIYYALLAVIVPMALFEILWYYSASFMNGGYELRIMQFAALFGWVLLGIREVFNKRPSRISTILYVFFVFSFATWLRTRFKFNNLNSSSFSLSAEFLNVVSKGTLFFAFALHIGYVGYGKR